MSLVKSQVISNNEIIHIILYEIDFAMLRFLLSFNSTMVYPQIILIIEVLRFELIIVLINIDDCVHH